MKAQLVTGGVVQPPRGVEYIEVEDELARASIVAHLIRIGQRPHCGALVGFSSQIRQGDADDVMSAAGAIDPFKCEPISEKIWCQITVTQFDIDAAHALINSQRLSYREEKTSQVLTDEELP